jgi:hypothetical protein
VFANREHDAPQHAVEKVLAVVWLLKRTGVDWFLYRSFNLHHPIHIVRHPKRRPSIFNPCGIIDQQIDPERGWIISNRPSVCRRHDITFLD